MANATVQTAVLTKLQTHWTSTPIRVAGDDVLPPADGSGVLFLEFPLAEETTRSVGSPGSNLYSEEGAFRFVYMVPKGSNYVTAATALDTLRANFRSKRFANDAIQTMAPSPPSEPYHNGPWTEISVSVPYRFFLYG